jgi:branched-chain amino acid transport system permease protein
MKATIQDPTGANLVGINVKRVYDFTFIIAFGLAAVSGILISVLYGMSPYMGQRVLIFGFVVVIVAGMGNLLGAAIVGIGIGLADSIFGQYVSTYYSDAFIYGIMVFVLLVRPKGLFSPR